MTAGIAHLNKAGVDHAATLLDTSPEAFDHVMQVNLYGAFHLMQLVLRHMRTPGSGPVIKIASIAGVASKGGSMNQSVYNASKHALVGLTRCAAARATTGRWRTLLYGHSREWFSPAAASLSG